MAGAGVEVPSSAKKADLVKLADANLVSKGAEGEVKAEEPKTGEYGDHGVDPVGPAPVVKGKDLEAVTMEDVGKSPTGRYEAVQVGSDAWRVFGPAGQKVSPLLVGEAKLSSDPKSPGEVLPSHGRAYHIAGANNTHLMKRLGSKRYEAIVRLATAQGFPR